MYAPTSFFEEGKTKNAGTKGGAEQLNQKR
jgi:hypothetical protein